MNVVKIFGEMMNEIQVMSSADIRAELARRKIAYNEIASICQVTYNWVSTVLNDLADGKHLRLQITTYLNKLAEGDRCQVTGQITPLDPPSEMGVVTGQTTYNEEESDASVEHAPKGEEAETGGKEDSVLPPFSEELKVKNEKFKIEEQSAEGAGSQVPGVRGEEEGNRE